MVCDVQKEINTIKRINKRLMGERELWINQGKAQAISKFKEKLKRKIFEKYDAGVHYEKLCELIEKTAQEIK